jgi:hypothetical protein
MRKACNVECWNNGECAVSRRGKSTGCLVYKPKAGGKWKVACASKKFMWAARKSTALRKACNWVKK